MKNTTLYKKILKTQKEIKQKLNLFTVLISILSLAVMVSFGFMLFVLQQEKPEEPAIPIDTLSSEPFESLELEAEAVFIFDVVNNSIVYERQGYEVMPLASIAKIMTALVALENESSDATIKLSKEAIAQEGNNFLIVDEEWRLDELIQFMLVTSSNDAAYELAHSIKINGSKDSQTFANAMNQKALDLGLLSFSFANETGLDFETKEASAFGSARDVAYLFLHAIQTYPEIFEASATDGAIYTNMKEERHVGVNTNIVAKHLPSLIASKTGYTDATGGNLAFVFQLGPVRPIVAVILGSSFQGRFEDAEKIVDATIAAATEF